MAFKQLLKMEEIVLGKSLYTMKIITKKQLKQH